MTVSEVTSFSIHIYHEVKLLICHSQIKLVIMMIEIMVLNWVLGLEVLEYIGDKDWGFVSGLGIRIAQ